MVVGAPGPAGFIVYGYPEVAVHGMVSPWRNGRKKRHQPLSDPPVEIAVLCFSSRTDQQAASRLHHLELRLEIVEIVLIAFGTFEQRILIECAAMQKGNVARIDPTLHRLEVVAFLKSLGNKSLFPRHRRKLVFRQRGL